MYPLNGSGGEIDQLRAPTRTPSLAADKVFLYCRAAPAARGPSPLAVGLIESHGAGASGSPGRDARMPPGLEERAPGWPAVGRVPADPGRSGPGDGRQRGIIQQARVPTDGRTPRNVAVEPAGAVPGRRGTGGCGFPVRRALSRHYAQRRERPGRTRTPADMHGNHGLPSNREWRAGMGDPRSMSSARATHRRQEIFGRRKSGARRADRVNLALSWPRRNRRLAGIP